MTTSSAIRLLLAATGCLLVFAPGKSSAQTTDDLFSKSTLQRVDLELHSADWAKLKENFQSNTFYPADFKWNGKTVFNVGIRSRGRGWRNANKPGLKVDFDKYSGNQKFLGLKSLVLDNLTQDPSGVHETVSMAFYERIGIPTPRETHVRLYVRGEFIGLYALVESVDKEFLARIYGSIGEELRTTAGSTSSSGRTTTCSPISAPTWRRSSSASMPPRTNRNRMRRSSVRSRN